MLAENLGNCDKVREWMEKFRWVEQVGKSEGIWWAAEEWQRNTILNQVLEDRKRGTDQHMTAKCFIYISDAVSRELPLETETIQTQLHQSTNEEHYTYTNVPWRLYLRKEVCRFPHTQKKTLWSNVKMFVFHFVCVCFFVSFEGFLS